MANVDALVQEGIAAVKAGRKADAKRLLGQALEEDQTNEKAWLYYSGCVDTPEEQQICLENVLTINPNNEKARKGLEALSKVLKKPTPLPPASAPKPPASTSNDVPPDPGNPFAGTGFDSNPYASSSGDPLVKGGWGDFDTSFAAPTSVDWGAGSAPTPGSGKNVNLPSAEEYDSWVAGLSLPSADNTTSPGTAATSPFGGFESSFGTDTFSSFGSESSAPFASTDAATPGSTAPFDVSFDFGNSGFAASEDPFQSDPFNTGGQSFSAGTLDDTADPFAGLSRFDNAESMAEPDFDQGNVPAVGKEAPRSSGSKSVPATSMAAREADPVADLFVDPDDPFMSDAEARSGGFAFVDTSQIPGLKSFFDQIPAEIKGQRRQRKVNIGTIISFLLLLVLNAASIGFLVFQLTQH